MLEDIHTPFIATATKPEHTRKEKSGKKTQVRSSVQKAKDEYKKAKAFHKSEISALRDQIKAHKLLIKQAKTSYKLVKLANK